MARTPGEIATYNLKTARARVRTLGRRLAELEKTVEEARAKHERAKSLLTIAQQHPDLPVADPADGPEADEDAQAAKDAGATVDAGQNEAADAEQAGVEGDGQTSGDDGGETTPEANGELPAPTVPGEGALTDGEAGSNGNGDGHADQWSDGK